MAYSGSGDANATASFSWIAQSETAACIRPGGMLRIMNSLRRREPIVQIR